MSEKTSLKKIFVAMSGGVDSSVAAALLVDAGFDVTGVFMKNWSGDDYGLQADCPWEEDQRDAEAVCKVLGIPFRSYNFEKEYRERVVEYFFNEYKKGRTPNPDVMCNKEVKFDVFLERALSEGADMIATGHYARVHKSKTSGKFELLRGLDKNKDQSYFLYTLNQAQLSKTLFPIGEYSKPEIRRLAAKYKLPTATKKDSQGICFIGKIDVAELLRKNISMKKGEIIDKDSGEVVGEHDGVMFYTIGQREGIGISGHPEPYYVVDKDLKKNVVYVAMGKKTKHLYKREIELENLHWISGEEVPAELNCEVAVRYRTDAKQAKLSTGQKIEIIFEEPIRAVAPGQSAVVYEGEVCLGGGVIKK
jgi:tRNA-uridine 2-sulfurtransferase